MENVVSDFDDEEILKQLDQITRSPDFTAGPRVKKFLTHLVTEELAGNGAYLKGTALAMDVFGRGVDFDSNNDPIVRIEGVKLRKALEHYYLTSGSDDPLVFNVPKGQYRPVFKQAVVRTENPYPKPRFSQPTIGIMAFTGVDTENVQVYRTGLPEEIALEISRFDHIRVLSGWQKQEGEQDALSNQSALSNCEYMLTGTVRQSMNRVRITVQLLRKPTDAVVWSERFDITENTVNVFDVQEAIAKQCAGRIADAYGIISEDLGTQYNGRDASDASVFEALLAFHAHMRKSRLDSLTQLVDLANNAVRDNPKSGLAHALVALGCIESVSMGEVELAEAIKLGNAHAEQAISFAPQCQEALFAAAVFALLNEDQMRFERLAGAAISSNPNGNLLIAMAGSWFSILGKTEYGAKLVQQAVADNPLLPLWTNITLSISDVAAGKLTQAAEKIRHIDARDCAVDWIFIAAIHSLVDEVDLATAALKKANNLGVDAAKIINDLPLSTTLAGNVQRGLVKLRNSPT